MYVYMICIIQVPVYSGCSKGLSTNGLKSDVIHGHDGLGGIAHEYQACGESLKPGHASQALIELVNKYPGMVKSVTCIESSKYMYMYKLFSNPESTLVTEKWPQTSNAISRSRLWEKCDLDIS